MIRLNMIVEGQTEETFVNKLLKPHLAKNDVYVSARRVTTGRKKGKIFRGGLTSYAKVKGDLLLWLKQDKQPNVYFTTMFDLYALPQDFPQYKESTIQEPYQRVASLEKAFTEDIQFRNFLPYIQLHEFEALLFTEPEKFSFFYLESPKEIIDLLQVTKQFESPELIDDGETTAPSKRILKCFPHYNKTVSGPGIALQIGLEKIRSKCPHFHQWLCSLEKLPGGD